MKENAAHMNSAYDVNKLCKKFIGQIETVVDFNDAIRVLFTPDQVATTA